MGENEIDLNLIDAFCDGNNNAFAEIVERYSEKVFKLAYRMTRDENESEDVSQEVFTTVFTKVHMFQKKSAFSSWIYRVTANVALMKLRKKKASKVINADKDMHEHFENFFVDPNMNESQLEGFEVREALQQAINSLETEYKTIFFLRDVDKLSNEEVASLTGLTVPAVKSRLHRTRMYLRERLEKFVDSVTNNSEEIFSPMVLGKSIAKANMRVVM